MGTFSETINKLPRLKMKQFEYKDIGYFYPESSKSEQAKMPQGGYYVQVFTNPDPENGIEHFEETKYFENVSAAINYYDSIRAKQVGLLKLWQVIYWAEKEVLEEPEDI